MVLKDEALVRAGALGPSRPGGSTTGALDAQEGWKELSGLRPVSSPLPGAGGRGGGGGTWCIAPHLPGAHAVGCCSHPHLSYLVLAFLAVSLCSQAYPPALGCALPLRPLPRSPPSVSHAVRPGTSVRGGGGGVDGDGSFCPFLTLALTSVHTLVVCGSVEKSSRRHLELMPMFCL